MYRPGLDARMGDVVGKGLTLIPGTELCNDPNYPENAYRYLTKVKYLLPPSRCPYRCFSMCEHRRPYRHKMGAFYVDVHGRAFRSHGDGWASPYASKHGRVFSSGPLSVPAQGCTALDLVNARAPQGLLLSPLSWAGRHRAAVDQGNVSLAEASLVTKQSRGSHRG